MRHALWILMLLGTLSKADEPAWKKRLDAAEQKAALERKRLGLDERALYGRYPTPEIQFGEGGEHAQVVSLCPGQSAVVKLAGKLVPGSTVIVESDDVEVTKERLTASGWEATLKARPGAGPQTLSAVVASPVTFASRAETIARIACRYRWQLKIDGGDALTVVTSRDDSGPLQATWKRGAAPPVAVPVTARLEGNHLTVQRVASQEEIQEAVGSMQKMMESPELKSLQERQQKAIAGIEGCMAKADVARQKCMEGISAAIAKLQQEQEALMAKNAPKGPPIGCDEVTVLAEPGGSVSGSATQCSEHAREQRLDVSGSYAAQAN